MIEQQRGQHATHVFTYRNHPIRGGMNNNGWQNGRERAGLGDLRILVELHQALVKIEDETHRWNVSLMSLIRDRDALKAQVTQQKNSYSSVVCLSS